MASTSSILSAGLQTCGCYGDGSIYIFYLKLKCSFRLCWCQLGDGSENKRVCREGGKEWVRGGRESRRKCVRESQSRKEWVTEEVHQGESQSRGSESWRKCVRVGVSQGGVSHGGSVSGRESVMEEVCQRGSQSRGNESRRKCVRVRVSHGRSVSGGSQSTERSHGGNVSQRKCVREWKKKSGHETKKSHGHCRVSTIPGFTPFSVPFLQYCMSFKTGKQTWKLGHWKLYSIFWSTIHIPGP